MLCAFYRGGGCCCLFVCSFYRSHRDRELGAPGMSWQRPFCLGTVACPRLPLAAASRKNFVLGDQSPCCRVGAFSALLLGCFVALPCGVFVFVPRAVRNDVPTFRFTFCVRWWVGGGGQLFREFKEEKLPLGTSDIVSFLKERRAVRVATRITASSLGRRCCCCSCCCCHSGRVMVSELDSQSRVSRVRLQLL